MCGNEKRSRLTCTVGGCMCVCARFRTLPSRSGCGALLACGDGGGRSDGVEYGKPRQAGRKALSANNDSASLDNLLFELAAQTIAVQQRLDAQWEGDLREFVSVCRRVAGTPLENASLSLAPARPFVQQSCMSVQLAAAHHAGTAFRVANMTYTVRYRAESIQHSLDFTVRQAPFARSITAESNEENHG
jgi:hypothetical protein